MQDYFEQRKGDFIHLKGKIMSAQELVDIVDRDNNVTDTVTRKEMRQNNFHTEHLT